MKNYNNQLKQIRYFLEYILIIPLFWAMHPLSIKAKSCFGIFVGKYIMYPFLLLKGKKRYAIIVKNLEIVLNKKLSITEAKRLVKEYSSNIVRIFTEGLGQRQMTKQWLIKNVEVHNIERLLEAHRNGRKIIIPSAHIGNWEIAHKYLYEVYGIKTTIIYRKQNNIKIDASYVKKRSHIELIEKRDPSALRKMVKSLASQHVLVVLLDQRNQTNGSPIEFFGITALFPTAISRLALKSNSDIYCGYCHRLPHNTHKFCLSFEEQTIYGKNSTPETITHNIFKQFEKWITAHPTQWFCLIQDIWRK